MAPFGKNTDMKILIEKESFYVGSKNLKIYKRFTKLSPFFFWP